MSIVAGKPLLQHTVEALVEAGVKECWFVVGYKPERLRAFFGNGSNFGITARYVEQKRPEGTAAAVRLAAEEMQPTEETLVIFGDNHYTADLIRSVASVKGDVIMGTSNADPRRNGLVVAKAGKLVKYELPSTSERGLVNTGLMKFTPAFFAYIRGLPAATSAQLPHALESFAAVGNAVRVMTADEGWDEADTVWDLLRMNERLLGEQAAPKGVVIPGVRIEGAVTIGPNSRIQPGAHLIGPIHIGSDCEIRENAIVGPFVSIRNSVHVGTNSEVRHSIINNNVFIDSQSVIRFSILDDGVRIGAFAVVAEGDITDSPGALPTRHGSVLGPDARIGTRVTVKPGSIVGEESVVGDGLVVGMLEARAKRV